MNYLTAPETGEEEGNSIFARIFRRSKHGPESPTPVDFTEALQEFMHRN